jgi:hypothetical protein
MGFLIPKSLFENDDMRQAENYWEGAMRPQAFVLFGDSVARGIVLDENGSYSPLKDSFAVSATRRLGIDLINKARFGCTIGKGLEIIRRFCQNSDSPPEGTTMAALEFGGNDCDFVWNEVSEHPKESHRPATPLDIFSTLYSEAIDLLRLKGFIPLVLTLPPLDPERYFAWFTRNGLDKSAILGWLGDIHQIFRWHEGYDKEIRTIASKRSDCILMDIRSAFLSTGNYRDYICDDGIHPNRKGHQLIESVFLDFGGFASSAAN